MKRFWLIFSQAVTVCLAAYFVLATLQPGWVQQLNRLAVPPLSQSFSLGSLATPWNTPAPSPLPPSPQPAAPGSLSAAAKAAALPW